MALEFDGGSSQSVALVNSADFSPGTGVFTIAVRFKTSHNFIADGMFWWDYGVVTNNLIFYGIGTDNKLFARCRDGDGDLVTVSTLGSVINDGSIHTGVFVRETQTAIRGYRDGVSIGTDSNAALGSIVVSNGRTPDIGAADLDPLNYFFYGEILELRFYKGKAFSAAEVKIFHEAQGGDNIIDNLVGRWLMNESPDGTAAAGANTVIDISGNGHHGTPVNSPVYRAAPVRLVRPII